MVSRALLCVLYLSASVSAQAPSFEVTSIRPSPPQTAPGAAGVRIAGSQVRITGVSLQTLLTFAYQVRPQQIIGPDWLGHGRFDLAATIPAGESVMQIPVMLQALLADRFHMKMHRESRPSPVYALGIARGGVKIQPSKPLDTTTGTTGEKPPAVNVTSRLSSAGSAIDYGGGSSVTMGNNRIAVRKQSMSAFADVLTRFVDRVVIDGTGLPGDYDLVLDFAPEDYSSLILRSAFNGGAVLSPDALRALDAASLDPLSGALEKAGLTLESKRAPLEIIVVDSISKTPTEN